MLRVMGCPKCASNFEAGQKYNQCSHVAMARWAPLSIKVGHLLSELGFDLETSDTLLMAQIIWSTRRLVRVLQGIQ